jgi:6-pyruvoyltetrahydropterin/6-carboxytetrahydropterin synthase
MINVTKEFEWDMAHRLENYDGQCNNVHGHRYRMLVTFARNDEDVKDGMVLDFKELKSIVKPVIDVLDHSFVYNINDKDSKKIASFMFKTINQKLFHFEFRTTAENMAKWFYQELNQSLKAAKKDYKCTKIVLFETPTCFAKYKE